MQVIDQESERAIEKARVTLAKAERVLIGAGAGLSTAAGLTYSGGRFRRYFSSFIERYGMTDMYSAGFYPFPTDADRWAYWAHHAWVNCLGVGATSLYRQIFTWVQSRDYFVITTNVDKQFEKAGFESTRLFETQGDYAHIQCAQGCHSKIYENETVFRAIEEDTEWGKRTRVMDEFLLPRCPVCGGRMGMHLRCDNTFIQTNAWYEAKARYDAFVAEMLEKPTVLLELGVGWNTPVWIRMPFERLSVALDIPLVRMNFGESYVDPSILKGVGVDGDIAQLLPRVLE